MLLKETRQSRIAEFALACVYARNPVRSVRHSGTADGLGAYDVLCENMTS